MKFLPIAATLLATALVPLKASAVYIEFSGGNGTPLSMTFADPITFTLTAADNKAFYIVIKDAIGTAPAEGVSAGTNETTSPTVSINNTAGTRGYIYQLYEGYNMSSDIKATDIAIFPSLVDLGSYQIGDVFTLNAGTYFTSFPSSSFVVPASGDYTMFLTNFASKARYSENGVVAVPEPSTWALIGVGVAGLAAGVRRKRLAGA